MRPGLIVQMPYALVENIEPLRSVNARIWKENQRWRTSSVLRSIETKKYMNRESYNLVWGSISQDINCPTLQWLGNPASGGKRACGVMTFLRHLQCVVSINDQSGIADDRAANCSDIMLQQESLARNTFAQQMFLSRKHGFIGPIA